MKNTSAQSSCTWTAEIEVTDIRPQTNTGRKLVKTMNRTGRAKGYAKGIAEHQLQITVVMPKNVAQPDWDEMVGAKLTTMDMDGNPLYSYGLLHHPDRRTVHRG